MPPSARWQSCDVHVMSSTRPALLTVRCSPSLHMYTFTKYPSPPKKFPLQGFALTSAYVLVYTLPRASALLSFDQPGRTLGLVGLFAVGMNLHMACQAHVFGSRGALGVALANALRGAALTLATASLFCSPDKPWLCLSQRSALSVAVTLAGGYLWGSAAAKPAAVPEARPHKEL